jgi:hypothetical protein
MSIFASGATAAFGSASSSAPHSGRTVPTPRTLTLYSQPMRQIIRTEVRHIICKATTAVTKFIGPALNQHLLAEGNVLRHAKTALVCKIFVLLPLRKRGRKAGGRNATPPLRLLICNLPKRR